MNTFTNGEVFCFSQLSTVYRESLYPRYRKSLVYLCCCLFVCLFDQVKGWLSEIISGYSSMGEYGVFPTCHRTIVSSPLFHQRTLCIILLCNSQSTFTSTSCPPFYAFMYFSGIQDNIQHNIFYLI